MRNLICLFALLFVISPETWPAQDSPTVLDLQKRSFFYGREYFILRSGRAKMILQADRANLGPAFTFMLFDARNASQTLRKERAFNFAPLEGKHPNRDEHCRRQFQATRRLHSVGGRGRYLTRYDVLGRAPAGLESWIDL